MIFIRLTTAWILIIGLLIVTACQNTASSSNTDGGFINDGTSDSETGTSEADTTNDTQTDDTTDSDPGTDTSDSETDLEDAPFYGLVITTNFETGNYSVIASDTLQPTVGIETIYSDSVCRFDPITQVPFIISRTGKDIVSVVDATDGFKIANQYSAGANSDTQDIAVVSPEKAYIARYSSAELLIVNPTEGTSLGTIDLSEYTGVESLPGPTGIYYLNEEVFVALSHKNNDFKSKTKMDHGTVFVLDPVTDQVKKEITLASGYGFPKFRYSTALDRLVLIEVGLFSTLDGGIEFLNPVEHSISGLVVTEQTLGGDIFDAVIATPNKGYAVILTPDLATKLVSFNPTTGQKLATIIDSDNVDLSYLEVTPDNKQLWVSSRMESNPGIRIFNTTTDEEITASPISVGLPPAMICFVQL